MSRDRARTTPPRDPGTAPRAGLARPRADGCAPSSRATSPRYPSGWPVFWEEARGANVLDADGNVYLDLTGAFGVGAAGSRPPRRGGRRASARRAPSSTAWATCIHRRSSSGCWSGWPRSRRGRSPRRAVLHRVRGGGDRPEDRADGHGPARASSRSRGATTGSPWARWRRRPGRTSGVRSQPRLYGGVAFAPFPDPVRGGADAGPRRARAGRGILERGAPNGDPIGAVLVEPVQGRAGARVAPDGFMARLSALAHGGGRAGRRRRGLHRHGAVRRGARVQRVGLRPDLVCLGKALGGGCP